jgi:hypothetical protein
MKTFRIIERTVNKRLVYLVERRRFFLFWGDALAMGGYTPTLFQCEGDARAWIEKQATPMVDQIIAVIKVA